MSPTATDPASAGRDLFLRLVDEFPTSARELVHTCKRCPAGNRTSPCWTCNAAARACSRRPSPRSPQSAASGVGIPTVDVDIAGERLCCWCSPSSAANAFGLGEVVSRFAELADGVRDAEVGNATRILTAAIAQSQAHATLALAAATAATFLGEFIELEDEAAAWAKATA